VSAKKGREKLVGQAYNPKKRKGEEPWQMRRETAIEAEAIGEV